MKHRKSILALLFVGVLVSGAWACTNWEHQTYASLSASKAVIDQASADYNAGKLPQTAQVRNLITHARELQITAVKSFEAYAVAKIGGGANLPQLQQAVLNATVAVTQVVADIQKLRKR